MKKPFIFLISSIYSISFVFGQTYKVDAEKFFKKFRNRLSAETYAINNFPSLEDCKYVFKGNVAYTYFAKINELKNEMKPKNDNDTYIDVKVESFATDDIINKNGEASPGVKAKDVFLPGVIFYKVSFLKQKNDESGLAFKYFVYINCRWLMFAKPMTVLAEK